MRRLIFLASAMTFVAACAPVAPSTRPYVPPAGAFPSGPVTGARVAAPSGALYAGRPAPRAGALRLCSGASARVGPVGRDGAILGATPSIATPAGRLMRNPTDGACLSSGFGFRARATGGGRVHQGLDLARPHGPFIYAAGPGRVVSAGWKGTYGLFVEIDHGRGVSTRYGHLRELNPAIRPGARVSAGLPLGRMGATGNATGVHLHYEVHVRGRAVDPLRYGT